MEQKNKENVEVMNTVQFLYFSQHVLLFKRVTFTM